MSPPPAIPDIITIVGTSYFQPIADLVDKLLQRASGEEHPARANHFENGYAAACVVLLVAMLESFVSRVRFLRNDEVAPGKDVPDQLEVFFPDLPTTQDLREVFLLRNIVVHNHVWHLDVSDIHTNGAPTLANPKQLKFQTKKNYDDIVDLDVRKTKRLRLNARPTSVDCIDVGISFQIIWKTLEYMSEKNYGHTPLAGQAVGFRGKLEQFGELTKLIPSTRPPSPGD